MIWVNGLLIFLSYIELEILLATLNRNIWQKKSDTSESESKYKQRDKNKNRNRNRNRAEPEQLVNSTSFLLFNNFFDSSDRNLQKLRESMSNVSMSSM